MQKILYALSFVGSSSSFAKLTAVVRLSGRHVADPLQLQGSVTRNAPSIFGMLTCPYHSVDLRGALLLGPGLRGCYAKGTLPKPQERTSIRQEEGVSPCSSRLGLKRSLVIGEIVSASTLDNDNATEQRSSRGLISVGREV